MKHASAPLDILLSAIPSLPRAALDQLVTHAIERMDELDPDPDLEDSEAGNHLVDDRGRWCGRGAAPTGPWYEDDEDPGDLEGIDEREPENEYGEEVSFAPDGARKSREAHVRRIRRTRCNRIADRWGGGMDVRYSLRMSTRAASLTMLRRRYPRLRQRKRRP